ncbi:MAG: DNA-3-methyladenine glycosylase 2 family protein [Gemmatimonadetes bacterium]|nr:MAG: DNA-3-methyladenine glycosylase 2 family protein [Gemmatimonadota bacterium]PYP64735.1 MAG: DNA-3-methyladenine glycosylase 2 family protein [Gemmatimonadota bacterium]
MDAEEHEFVLDSDQVTQALCAADPKFAPLIERAGPYRLQIEQLQSPFQALAESIVYQQLTGKAAATIHGRLVALFPGKRLSPQRLLLTHHRRLRSAGLSRAKVLALKDLAAKTIDGTVPTMRRLQEMPDAEIVEHLTAVRGIGQWTVEMLLIFRLGRPDVLPVTDYGVRKGYARIFGGGRLPSPKYLARRGERWRPYRSAAAWYLWRANELPRKNGGRA